MSARSRLINFTVGMLTGAGVFTSVSEIKPRWDNPQKPQTIDSAVVEMWTNRVFDFEGRGGVKQWEAIAANKYDRGGVTNSGLTKLTFYALCEAVLDTVPSDSLFRSLTPDQIKPFYYSHWGAVCGDAFKVPGVAITLTEIAWGSGVGKSWQRLAIALSRHGYKFPISSAYNPKLIQAANTVGAPLLKTLTDIRLEVIEWDCKQNPNQQRFRNGWISRVNYCYNFCTRYGLNKSVIFVSDTTKNAEI